MTAQPVVIWKIFARESFDTEDSQEFARECYQDGVIAVGWNAIGHLNAIPSREELFRLLLQKSGHWVDNNALSIGQWTGSLWAFRSEVKRGHYVVCPDRNSGQYYVGLIRSAHAYYDLTKIRGTCHFAHRRNVKWLRTLNKAEMERIWPTGQFGGRQTVSHVHNGGDRLLRFLKRKRRSFAHRAHLPIQPDMEWGRAAEARAMAWLRELGREPVNEADLHKGWDISCGEDKFEVKGRKSERTAVRLTENEWMAAKRLKKQYTVLIFTAATKAALEEARPRQMVDPANNPESWMPRAVWEYLLVD
jgi:hypothetical protein